MSTHIFILMRWTPIDWFRWFLYLCSSRLHLWQGKIGLSHGDSSHCLIVLVGAIVLLLPECCCINCVHSTQAVPMSSYKPALYTRCYATTKRGYRSVFDLTNDIPYLTQWFSVQYGNDFVGGGHTHWRLIYFNFYSKNLTQTYSFCYNMCHKW